MIDCTNCKAYCCRHVGRFTYMKEYDRGDGVCKYLTEDNLCAIYEGRPDICNTDKMYEKYFSRTMSRDYYDAINSGACEALRATQNDKQGSDV